MQSIPNRINTSQDRADYDRDSYQPDRIADANNLYDGWLAAKKNSDWKPKVQIFEMDWLSNIAKLQKEIDNRTYRPQKPTRFVIRERGKERYICGEQVRDRVVEHALNDCAVIPSIKPFLIYDNGASLKGKGVSFTRERLTKHLVNYYSHYGNDGYVLLIDYSKYYDNIRHDVLIDLFRKYVHDDTALWLLEIIISQFKVDVSYMSEDEFSRCMSMVFDSAKYSEIDPSLLTREKFMPKHLDIGNQTSQSAGILYPSPLDNYIKIVCGVKYYGRYMDDSYILHPNKGYLELLKRDIIKRAADIGIFVNQKKTRIVKISSMWRFLQVQYSLTDTGRIVHKINPRLVTVQRRKMKLLASKLSAKEYHDWVFSWLKSHRKYLSNQQYRNIMELYKEMTAQANENGTYQ